MYDPTLPFLLPRVRVPTLVVWGREDRIVPLECAEVYQRVLPQSRLEIINQCGHYPQLEKPQEFTRLVGDFLLKA
jgi:pimeloyl-ACP methyl ester carboxylesterase